MVKQEYTVYPLEPPGYESELPTPAAAAVESSRNLNENGVNSSSPEATARRTPRKRTFPDFFVPPIRRQRTATRRRRGPGRPPKAQTVSPPRRRGPGRPPKDRSTSLCSLQEAHATDSNERPPEQMKPVQLTEAQSSSQAQNEARTIDRSNFVQPLDSGYPVVVPRCQRSKNVGGKSSTSEGVDPKILQHMADALQYLTVSQTSPQFENVYSRLSGFEPNLVDTLKAINKKYGDITKDSSLKSDCMRSFVLIGICRVVQDLEKKRFEDHSISSLNSHYTVVLDAEDMKVNVQWLRKRLDEIKDAVTLAAEAKGLVNERNARLANIELKKEELILRRVQLERIKSEVEKIEGQLGQEAAVVDELSKKIRWPCHSSSV